MTGTCCPRLFSCLSSWRLSGSSGVTNSSAWSTSTLQPEPPKNLMAVPTTNRIDLSWEAPSQSGVTGYNVKRGTTQGQYSLTRQPGPATSLSYADTDVTDGMTYYYVVSALYGTKESSNTTELPVTSGDPNLTALVTQANVGTKRNDFGGWVGMGIRVASTGLAVKALGRWFIPGNADTHSMKIVDALTKTDVPGGSVTIPLPTADLTTERFVYAVLPASITLTPNADYYIISQETTGGDQFYDSASTTVMTTAKASRVYAVNGDGLGTYNVSGVLGSTYGPVDIEY
jgi:Fibronectin type III domain.